MQPDSRANTGRAGAIISRVAAKEITLFFASPIAYLFLGTFAVITLFVFFWVEAFFSRNIADVRPLFEWMPILLIFLSAALTMRLWSEERRSGTLEYVHTQAVPLWYFVLGKFLGCLFLLALALAITLLLPTTVAVLGDLDWGPVWSGYLAALLLGAGYLSIGLFVSARSDNQIVSLICASMVCGIFYLLGAPTITDLFGNRMGEWLRLLGAGSRFDSITRGVIDLRDLYYYLSIVLAFLALNTLALEQERWAVAGDHSHHRKWRFITGLVIANALCANLWLHQLTGLRIDATAGNQYSISDATRGYLDRLQEPLLMRGYFSSKTHPLLAPLVPQIRDLMSEYQIAGKGRLRVEFVDPMSEPELEEEANRKYGIQPVPFQVADRYQSSIVSSYFNVLVQYGDEYKVLDFSDLIEIQARSESDIDVQLRNPEHDLTRAIKKTLNSYQAGGNLFNTLKGEIVFNGYLSPDPTLPEQLVEFRQSIDSVLEETKIRSGGRFTVTFIDPDEDNGRVGRQIAEDYGFEPMTASLLSDRYFYFYMTLANAEQIVQIPLDDMTSDSFRRNLNAGIKRFAGGFTKTVALAVSEDRSASFSQLENYLRAEFNIAQEDLRDGTVSGEADILLLAAPGDLDEKQLFAIDQFLMQGGTVLAATSPYSADLAERSLSLKKHRSGMEKWLRHHGLNIEDQLVLDPQNSAFPVPVTRDLGGFQLQEIRMLDYPYFIDIRGDGLNQDNLITAELPQATLAWASPISVDTEKQGDRTITRLLHSSAQAWLSSSLDIVPKLTSEGLSAYVPEGEQKTHLLGVISQGRFDSYYAGQTSPLVASEDDGIAEEESDEPDEAEEEDDPRLQIDSVIERSPESARIILLSSNDFLRDQVILLSGSAQRTEYLHTLQMTANALDWSLEDADLLSIRSRGHFNRTLPPMEQASRLFWEYLNYGLAVSALIVIALLERRQRRARQRRYLALLDQPGA